MATTSRIYKGKTYQSHLLRRTFRVGSQVKHETLGNISHLPAHLIDLVRRSLAGEEFLPARSAFQIERSLPHGHVQALLGSIRRLGVEALLASKPCPQRDLVVAMIAERLLHPCSKLATTRLWHASTLADELNVGSATEDDLYQALDWLLARQAQVEKRLAQRHLTTGAIVLYDVSSSYYEGHTCPLARLGHNRDGKKGLPIIVYGLLTDGEGRPVAIDVYPGNTGDPTTVPDQVEKLRQRFGLSRVVLVGDRGMLTEAQIRKLKQHTGLGWISALRGPAIRELVETKSLQLSLFDDTNLAEITSPEYPGERLVACFNPLLAEERRRKRRDLIEATEKDLAKIAAQVKRRTRTPLREADIALKAGKVLNRYKVAKHFSLTIANGVFRWERREDTIRRESELDGIYVVRTNQPADRCSAEDAVRRYKSLAQVERAFRSLKGLDLRIRPIHHRTEDHVRGHILVCMLAFYVEWHMRRNLAPLLFDDEQLSEDRLRRDPVAPAEISASAQAKKSDRTTADGFPVHNFDTLLQELSTRCRNTCRMAADLNAPAFHQLTEPTTFQRRAFQLLGL
ncbi:MAG TPA: IS1634 family transposase [Magnetospirillum sp.]|nr:IS1634 family transposase [Magnetospirillum sp.]